MAGLLSKGPHSLDEPKLVERRQLDADVKHSADIVDRGADALSHFDREIAYSSFDNSSGMDSVSPRLMLSLHRSD